MTDTEKRMAGDYEIILAITLGDKEVVLGENLEAPPDERYMCAFCRCTDMALFYEEAMAYSSYLEAATDFADRLKEQCIRTEAERRQPAADGIDDSPITADGCTVIDEHNDLRNRFVVIRQDVLGGNTVPPPTRSNSARTASVRCHTLTATLASVLTSIPAKRPVMSGRTSSSP